MNQLWFTDRDIRRRWAEIKGFFWEEIEHQTRWAQQRFLETLLRVERETQLGARWYQRGARRRDQANGYYARELTTSVGVLSGLLVPRSRRGVYRSQILPRYRRRPRRFDRWIQEAVVLGLSTRRTVRLLARLLGVSTLSATTVSRVVQQLRDHCHRFHRRRLDDRWAFLFVDGFSVPIRGAVRRPQTILFALGMTPDGQRQMLGFRVVPAEKTIHVQAFFEDLCRRGLTGHNLQLIVHDGSQGLAEAAAWVFPHVQQQRCSVHKLRNLADRLHHAAHRKDILRAAAAIYRAPNRLAAVQRAQRFRQRWEPHEPRAVRLFLRDLDDTLTFYQFPPHLWTILKSTNLLERQLRELRRRVRLVDSFRDETSCQTLIYGILVTRNLIPGELNTLFTQDS